MASFDFNFVFAYYNWVWLGYCFSVKFIGFKNLSLLLIFQVFFYFQDGKSDLYAELPFFKKQE